MSDLRRFRVCLEDAGISASQLVDAHDDYEAAEVFVEAVVNGEISLEGNLVITEADLARSGAVLVEMVPPKRIIPGIVEALQIQHLKFLLEELSAWKFRGAVA